MLKQPLFSETRIDVMHALMVAHPFATLVSAATGGLSADHVPLVLHVGEGECGVLRGHLAANNALFRQTDGPIEVLSVFQGPQTYVTPSWYASKQEHGKVVPTWNYVVVHARGTLNFTQDTAWLMQHLSDLTAQHESHRAAPWAVTDAPDDFIARQLRHLVGFEISVTDLQGTWKVSQNKALQDWTGVRDGLSAAGDPEAEAISKLVEERARSKAP
ncbi:FMN-binding negative transcriptional regulator [Yoonia sp. BS5-3]|uniref:FMN-binding negative transcriptional regulator n=1 Tax=Yoonia phaeophyticola TaxID=3137369 RepID=A0ABZ2V1R1_9RHOB